MITMKCATEMLTDLSELCTDLCCIILLHVAKNIVGFYWFGKINSHSMDVGCTVRYLKRKKKSCTNKSEQFPRKRCHFSCYWFYSSVFDIVPQRSRKKNHRLEAVHIGGITKRSSKRHCCIAYYLVYWAAKETDKIIDYQ